MRKWEKPILKVEKIELSQAVAAGCGDFDYVSVTCRFTKHNLNHHTNNHPGQIQDYSLGAFVKDLSDSQYNYYLNNNWSALMGTFGHQPGENHTILSQSVSVEPRNIPFNS